MPVIDAHCPGCQVTEAELVPTLATAPAPCLICGGPRHKAFSLPIVVQRPWMTDSAMTSNARHREWLKTPEAKAMDLSRAGDDE